MLEFVHSLKNSRDDFDGYFPETNREGWKDKDGNPAKLTGFSVDVYEEFKNKDENQIWSIIKSYLDINYKLRQQALDFHGYKCQVCDFDFELTYGKWGKEFAEVHHIKPLSELNGVKYETDPRTDLAVLCSNCHRMIHRKKNFTLKLSELKSKLL